MSWNVTLTSLNPEDLEQAARKSYTAYKANYHDDGSVFGAMDEQFDAALGAAKALLPTVGEGLVNVILSGHANPGHRPRQGWANDTVHVTVTSVVQPAEAPAGAGG